jgi:hypothetical protein
MTDSMYQQVYTTTLPERKQLLTRLRRRAIPTLEFVSHKSGAAFFRSDPGTTCPRRIVANVLRVSTFEFGKPVAMFVPAESYDLSFHRCWSVLCRLFRMVDHNRFHGAFGYLQFEPKPLDRCDD